MERDNLKHVEEERLEAYSTNSLAEDEVAPIEEHLLFCETCQDRLEMVDRYNQAMRGAAKRLREEETAPPQTSRAWDRLRAWLHTPAPLWAGGLAMAGVILMIGLHLQVPERPGSPVDVELQAIRGESTFTAPPGHALNLRLDNRGVAELPAWPIEIVDEVGTRVWSGTGTWSDTAILAAVDKSFTPGTYFVRLLKEGEDPAREYELIVRRSAP